MFVNFQFATTAEFGEAQYIKVFVGTEEGESSFLINDIEAYNATVTMPLADVLQQAGLSVDTNKYIYIRSELLTLAEYGANSPRILEQENFYSFTNPVWIKLNQDVTINVTEQQLKEFLIYPNPVSNVLYISTDLKIKQANVYDASKPCRFLTFQIYFLLCHKTQMIQTGFPLFRALWRWPEW